MEVGSASEHSAFIPQPSSDPKACRDASAGYRPFAAQAGAPTPCKITFLPFQFALESSQQLGHRAAFINAVARGSMPNNAFNCRSLCSLDSQKLRFCLPVSLIIRHKNKEQS